VSRVLPRVTVPLAFALAVLVGLAALVVRSERADAASALDVQSWAPTAGTPVPGALLTADPGTWSDPKPEAYAYQWLRDGVAIPGATAQDYEVTPTDVGHQLAPQVTGSKPGWTSDTFVGSPLAARRIGTSLTLDVRRAAPPGKQRQVWIAEVELRLERPYAGEGTVTVTKLKHGRPKELASGPVSRGVAFLRLPWKDHAPRGTTELTACFSGTDALEPVCSVPDVVKRKRR
jgi:hypothetical protein